jgi:dienelactone hydrolase
MEYDPFARGPFPVGVRTGLVIDQSRGSRQISFEVWYPAAPEHAGRDLSHRTQDGFIVVPDGPTLHQAAVRNAAVHAGTYPLILFSHSSGGHRRQSSFLCTHLASHGYIVTAADHGGNTAVDVADRAKRAAEGQVLTPQERDALVQGFIADRVPDLRFLLDRVLAGAASEVSDQIDEQRIGLIGWSFGGWAVLAALEVDDRFCAVLALAPAGNSKPLPGIIPATLTFAWKREVATLFLVAEKDRFTPLSGQYELLERAPSSKGMFILRGADHGHFADQIEDSGACRPEHAHLFTRSLGLAHMDAALKEDRAAQQFMAHDPAAMVRDRGVDAVAYAAESLR